MVGSLNDWLSSEIKNNPFLHVAMDDEGVIGAIWGFRTKMYGGIAQSPTLVPDPTGRRQRQKTIINQSEEKKINYETQNVTFIKDAFTIAGSRARWGYVWFCLFHSVMKKERAAGVPCVAAQTLVNLQDAKIPPMQKFIEMRGAHQICSEKRSEAEGGGEHNTFWQWDHVGGVLDRLLKVFSNRQSQLAEIQ